MILDANNTIMTKRNLSPSEWSTTNEQTLTEIFAETGADREIDFDREKCEEDMYFQPSKWKRSYPQIIYQVDIEVDT